jgi:hypothetical protein
MASAGSPASSAGADADEAGASDVDIEALAHRVYHLMREEIRLGRVRGELLPKPTGPGLGRSTA